MAKPDTRFMGVSAIKQGREEAFLPALEAVRGELRTQLVSMGAAACSLFRLGRYLFLYAELPEQQSGGPNATAAGTALPQSAEPDSALLQAERLWDMTGLRPLLDAWPSLQAEASFVLRMNDIFHDDVPMDDVPWRRPDWKPAQRHGKLARLKPAMYSSYVYLHYQLQEELPRKFNKYYMIGSFGAYIFSYAESPGLVEPSRAGLLDSKQTPSDWPAAMLPHFEPWGPEVSEEEQLWRDLQPLFHFGDPGERE
ncbi:hypothetical protein [Paenibacillus sacheonensis]|uniref:Uncharacterized protein n=1 Tax=Paenibacillus sacheonensis TaxID=742054 RepID=A0A7X4YSW2_9BACL|nr:hypothetical protein [Paenibacillus sacheonensis]MBM7567146.1 hypothetical protein [Paenibacillus sacheonensis]NBC70929.1 hypothetical protein [Paenibacillus sacheonensis]